MARIKYYRRLPGRRRTFAFTRNSLWLGEDHLLHVINRGYTEEYKRFYYRDIQAVVMRRTRTGAVITLLLGVLNLFFLALVLLGWKRWEWEPAGLIAILIPAGFCLFVLLIYVFRGPTCVCHLRTVVHFESLPSLSRVAQAIKAMQMLRAR